MRRLRFWLNTILPLVPLLIIGLGAIRLVRSVIAFLNSNRRLAGTMSAEATRALGREVRVGDVHVTGNLWSFDASNRIDLFDVSVANGPTLASGAIARANRVALWYNLRQVLANDHPRTPIVDELRLDSPQVLLQRTTSGRWNLQDLLPKQRTGARSLTDKVTFTDGTLLYSDRAFPHPPRVPERPLDTRLSHLRGVVLIRPDKSMAFDVAGAAEPIYMRDFHASGSVVPSPLRVQGHVAATRVALPELASRLAPRDQLTVSAGHADLDAGILYVPPVGTPPRRLDTQALIAHGTLQLFDAAATGKMVYAPAEHVNGFGTFTTDSILGNISGTYAGMPVRVDGAVLGLTLPPLGGGQHAVHPPAPPMLSLRGTVAGADWRRVSALGFAPAILNRLPKIVRSDLRNATFLGNVQFQIAGPANNPQGALTGQIAKAEYAGYRGDNVDVRAAYAGRTFRASVKGRYAGGDVVLRGAVALDDSGAFEAQAQGRGLALARLGRDVPRGITGLGRIDLAIRGSKGRTPNITAQAEADNVNVNGQSFRHVYAQADTVGPTLVVRRLTAEDPKGQIVGSGTIGMKSRRLDLTIDADEINFGALAKAAIPPEKARRRPLAANPNANSAISRLADVEGFGYARTRLTGTLDKPQLQGQVYAFGVQVGGVELDKVTLTDFALSNEKLHLTGVASRYPGQLRLAGDVYKPFSRTPELSLQTRVDELDLKTLLQLAGVDRKDLLLTGTLSTDSIPVRGTLSSPQTPDFFTANLQNATVNGVPIRNASLTMRYQAEGLLVKNASASVADGLVLGSGWLPFDGPVNFTVHGGGLALQPLEEAAYLSANPDQTPIIVQGDFNFDARIGGTLKQPTLVAQSVTTGALTYNGFKIGSVKATGEYTGQRVRIDTLVLNGPNRIGPGPNDYDPKDGVIAINGLTYDLDTKQIRTDVGHPIRFESIPLERLHDLAYVFVDVNNADVRKILDDLKGVTGPVSATAGLGGTLDEPSADLTWNAAHLKALNYEITSATGSALIDKNRLIYPSPSTPTQKIKVSSPYVDVLSPSDPRVKQIVVEFDRPGMHGLIRTILDPGVSGAEIVPADISVSNINLQFLQQIVGTGVARRIEGEGDVAITAQGRTTQPDLEFSASLRKVAIYSAVAPKAPVTLDHVDLLQGSAREGIVKIGSLRAIKNDPVTRMPYETSVSATLTGFTYQSPFLPPEAELTIKGDLPVAFVAVAVPGILRDTSRGTVTLNAAIKSLRDKPSVSGDVVLNVPRLEATSTATGIQDLLATLKLTNDRLAVTSFSAHTYIYGKPREASEEVPGRIQAPARPPKSPPKVVSVSENDPKRRGSEIAITGSIPLGLTGDHTRDANDGLFVRIFDRNEEPLGTTLAPAAAGGKKAVAPNAKQVALTFNESPLPNSSTGALRGTLRTDPSKPLRIHGSLKEPTLTGRAILYNAYVTPPAEQKPGTFTFPILPNFDLALALGQNVRIHTAQLDARVDTDKDIVAHGRLLENANDLSLDGTVNIDEGKLRLPTATFTVLHGATLHVSYPSYEAGETVVGLNIDLQARGFVYATSQSGVRKRYEVTVTARGPLTGDSINPITGQSNLALSFETNPNDLAGSQQLLTERLAGAIIGMDSLDQAGRTPGAAFTTVLSSVFTGSVLPGIFDRTATNLGFEELSLGYDPVDRLTLQISRHLFGPLYVSYYRTLTATQERYDLKVSFRFHDRYQLSYDLDEQHTQKLLLEGVWKF
jgi:hypothetical protein